ncbi:MAG: glutamate formimidoyltransferase [Rikenella sp.]|nr:glutamate formimidoyltransferase [Rikenella sp.]
MQEVIECVPNFSEGADRTVIDAIVDAVDRVEGAYVLHVDSGAAANRTVITLAGSPEAVCEAAFRAVREAAERIDMRQHSGEHPRIGATDVLPLVPVRGISLDRCAELARELARRVGEELGIPVFCYEAAASAAYRKRLEACRKGEYEGLREKLNDPAWQPDFGPARWSEAVERTGACVIGARNFLGAVNFNLAGSGDREADVAKARAVAREIREAANGRWSLPGVKAIGWWIEEYGFAQVSTNLTDMHATGLGQAYEAVAEAAKRHGARVSGMEIIGLLPEWALVEAGRRSGNPKAETQEAVEAAVKYLGLDTMRAQGRLFDPNTKIVERVLSAKMGV